MLRRLFSKRPAHVEPSVPAGQRVYVIGDIHGRLDLLDDLLDQIREDNAKRDPCSVELVFLGDLIDRGPDSAGVVRRAMVKPAWADRVVALKGNHEDAMLEALDGNFEMARTWLGVGGQAALQSWGLDFGLLENGTIEDVIVAARAVVPAAERSWLCRMRTSYQIGGYYFAHAGIRPKVSFDKQTAQDLLWIREDFLNSRNDHGMIIVHGHSISADVEVMKNRIGIDTGAYKTGKLTSLCLQGYSRWFLQTNIMAE
jgi:serine/threonine protein phosphatase 1